MKQKYSGNEPIIGELVTLISQIEYQLKVIQTAFAENQVNGEKLRDRIRKFQSQGIKTPSNLNDSMNTITCLREWHWNYIERFERFIYESKSIYLEFENFEKKTGFLAKNKRKKILGDVSNFVFLGRKYIETLSNVFDGDYLTLIPGEEIRKEALKLMSARLGAGS